MNSKIIPLLDIPYEFVAGEDVSGADLQSYGCFPCRIRMAIFLYCVEGSMQININLQEYYVEKGQILVLFPNSVVQVIGISDDVRAKIICVSSSFVENSNLLRSLSAVADVIMRNPIASLSSDQAEVFACAVGMVRQSTRVKPEEIRNQLVYNTIQSISAMLLTRYSEENSLFCKGASRSDEILKQFYALVLKHYTSEHKVNFYANELNISSSYLCALVSRKSGTTAMQIINRSIITDAKAQLKNGTLPIKAIALSLGFDNPAFFSKFFRSQTGKTPVEYRNEG